MIDDSCLQKALDAGAASAGVKDGPILRPHLVKPEGYTLEPVPDAMLADPWRLAAAPNVFDPASFVKYFTDYCNESSRIFVDADAAAPKIVAVLDYHSNDGGVIQPDWCQHRLLYKFRHTPEWITWSGKNRVSFKQIEFARFIEENLPDIVYPAQADMLQISKTMQAQKNTNFSSETRLENGDVQFAYETVTSGKASRGELEIPGMFRVKIAPFEGSDEAVIECRFRYAIKEGALELRYEMVRPHKVIEAAVARVIEQIKSGVVNPITYGTV